MDCASPHPQRNGLELHPDLAVAGSLGSEEWARCRRCGAWFWLSTDDRFVEGTQLEAALAERALGSREPQALVQLLTQYDLPKGPIWDTAALRDFLRTLLPHKSDQKLRDLLAEPRPGGRWAAVMESLDEAIAARRETKPAPPYPFAFELSLPGYHFSDSFELEESLVLLGAHAEVTALRIDRAGQPAQISLGALPRYLAHDRQRVLFAVGDQVFGLHSNGQISALPPDPVRYRVVRLDGGWWLFFPESGEPQRFVEWHEPGTEARAKILVSFGDDTYPLQPRRWGSNWLVSNAVDQEGTARALSLFDDSFGFLAQSSGLEGGRQVVIASGDSLWVETAKGRSSLERWERRGERLERTLSVDARSPVIVDETVIAALNEGPVVAHSFDGKPLWQTPRESEGSSYLTAAGGRVVVYDDERAQVLDARDGAVLESFKVNGVDLCQTWTGTVYLRSHTAVWIIAPGKPILRTRFLEGAQLLAAAGENALLRDGDGLVTVLGPDGAALGSFLAPNASFSVSATRRGPYVVEIGRIRF
jgi:hypothetical protein